MVVALLALVAAPNLDAFDAANLALTSCSYAAFRDANASNVSETGFERALATACADEFAALRREIVAIERSRGESGPRADAFADRQIARFRADFRRQYARRAEDAANLEALQRALEQENRK